MFAVVFGLVLRVESKPLHVLQDEHNFTDTSLQVWLLSVDPQKITVEI